MGYLYDRLEADGKNWADCPEYYPYAMIVDYTKRDDFMYPEPEDAIGLAIKDKLPDVEEWQFSVVRPGHVKFRFKSASTREIAKDALLGVPIEVSVTRVAYMNPPDQLDRGEIAQ